MEGLGLGELSYSVMIWSKDSNEWSGISLPLIVPCDLEISKAISLFNMRNAFAIVSARCEMPEKRKKSEKNKKMAILLTCIH